MALKKEKKWLTLKEAAKISGYAPDYIGELIRKGKIEGKQIFYNVAWVTTKEAILTYKEKQRRKEERKIPNRERVFNFLRETKQKILLEFEILKLFFKTFKTIFLLFLALFILLVFVLGYFFFSSQSTKIQPAKIPFQESKEIFEGLKF